MNSRKTLFTIAISILLLTMIAASAPIAATTLPARPSGEPAWIKKFHPAFLKTIEGLSDEDVVEAIIRLKDPPNAALEVVKGHHDLVVETLRTWAARTQPEIVNFITSKGGIVLNRFWLINAILVKAPVKVLKQVAESPLVTKIFENFEVHVIEPVRKVKVEQVESWGIFKIRAPEAWALGYTGKGIRICVLDTGVDITHPALAGKMLTLDPTSPYYPGGWMEFDEYGNPVLSEPHDTHGHGTHTSGTALGGNTEDVLIGVAPEATLMHGLCLPGGGGTFAQVIAAMEWTVDPYYIDPDTGELVPTGLPAHVVSMSWGAAGYYGNELLDPIKHMLLANIIPVAAIGNEGPGTSDNPGNIWGCFGIGATDEDDDVAYWSSGEEVNWPDPPEEWPFYDYYPSTYIKPDFSAPGVNIVSSVPGGGYEAWSGTSMATPHVSGTVALVLQAAGWFDYSVPDEPEKIYEILKEASLDLGDPGQDIRYGWGRIDAYEAVRKAMEYAKTTGVEGYVFDAETGEPIPWATVTVNETGQTVSVNASGYFKIPLDPGNYTLIIEAWGYFTQNITVEVIALNGTITGTVYDVVTNETIEGATVAVVELNMSTTTGPDGVYTLEVPPGTYTVTAWKEGYAPANATVTVGENETVIVDFGLVPIGNGTIAGYVFDNETGLPIPGAIVAVVDVGLANTTDTSGYYVIKDVPAGVHDVAAWALGYGAEEETVIVPVGEVVIVNFTLTPLPPAVAVVGNAYAGDHIPGILEEAGFNVVEYDSVEELLADLPYQNIRVVVLDHWHYDGSPPDLETVLTFLEVMNFTGIGVVFLGAPYASYTGLRPLYEYSDDIEAAGFPAPDEMGYSYPSPENVLMRMLDLTHPIFEGVEPDVPPDEYYVADLVMSDYCDYEYDNFVDDPVTVVGNITDESIGVEGHSIAIWETPTGAVWIYLSTAAESSWMQYMEPGSDGMYSNNTLKVLVNAVSIAFYGLDSVGKPVGVESGGVKPKLYTYVEVYMERLPYGYIEGFVYSDEGEPLAGAEIVVEGTPVKLVTNETGGFKTWLPEGVYNVTASYPGYKTTTITVSITANETTYVTFVLPRAPRVAVMHDYAGEIKRFLSTFDWYVADYTNWTQLIADVETGFYDLVILAGHYGAIGPEAWPTPEQMDYLLALGDELKLGFLFLDNWGGAYGVAYGINILHTYYNDPAIRGEGWGDGYVYVMVEEEHPIFRGWSAGDVFYIVADPWADYSYFDMFSGEMIGSIGVQERGVVGKGVAYKVTEGQARWALLAAMAPEQWTDMTFWTAEGFLLFYNAAKWALMKPLNVTLTPPAAHVGDVVEVTVTGARPYVSITVLFNGVPIAAGSTDENGTFTCNFTVPVLPYGEYPVEAITADELYYGRTMFTVLPKIEVVPSSIAKGGMTVIVGTGFAADTPVYVYLDGNYLGILFTDELGTFTEVFNIPEVIEGYHVVSVRDYYNLIAAYADLWVYEVGVADVKVSVAPLHVAGEAAEAYVAVSYEGSLVNASYVNAYIVSPEGEIIDVNVTPVATGIYKAVYELPANASIGHWLIVAEVGYFSEDGSVVAYGVGSAGLEVSKALQDVLDIADLVVAKSDEIVAVFNTEFGQLETRVTDLNDTLYNTLTAVYSSLAVQLSEVNASLTELAITKSGEVIAKIEAGNASLAALLTSVNGSVYTVGDEIVIKIDSARGEVLDSIQSLNETISGAVSEFTETVSSLSGEVESVKGTAGTATTTSTAGTGLAVLAIIIGALSLLRRR